MSAIPSTSYQIWQKVDAQTEPVVRDGKIYADHRASAAENFEEAGSNLGAIPSMWQNVFHGKAIMGGGDPKDRVADAEGFWGKAGTAIAQHGSNAVMAAFLSVMGLTTGVIDGLHGVLHGGAAVFQRD